MVAEQLRAAAGDPKAVEAAAASHRFIPSSLRPCRSSIPHRLPLPGCSVGGRPLTSRHLKILCVRHNNNALRITGASFQCIASTARNPRHPEQVQVAAHALRGPFGIHIHVELSSADVIPELEGCSGDARRARSYVVSGADGIGPEDHGQGTAGRQWGRVL